jgi:hypothetical protein
MTTSIAELQERVRKLLAIANDKSASEQERKVAQAKQGGAGEGRETVGRIARQTAAAVIKR